MKTREISKTESFQSVYARALRENDGELRDLLDKAWATLMADDPYPEWDEQNFIRVAAHDLPELDPGLAAEICGLCGIDEATEYDEGLRGWDAIDDIWW